MIIFRNIFILNLSFMHPSWIQCFSKCSIQCIILSIIYTYVCIYMYVCVCACVCVYHLYKPLSELDQYSPYAHDNQFSGCPFNSFTPISQNSLRKIILQCAPKTCELDAIPTSLFFFLNAWMQYCLHWLLLSTIPSGLVNFH